MSDIAVVGMACRFPRAPDLDAFWRVIKEGEVCFQDIGDDRWTHSLFFEPNDVRAADKTYAKRGAFLDDVKEFAALHYGLAPRRVQVMDPQQRLLVETVRVALQDSGFERRGFDKHNTGVFVGSSVSEYKDLLLSRLRAAQMLAGDYGDKPDASAREFIASLVQDVAPSRAFTMSGTLLNMGPATVSQVFDLHGPSFNIDAACSSALVAVHEAVTQLRGGQCNVAIAGGVYLNLAPDNLVAFSRIGAVSRQGECRPFDSRADGFVMGEGVGVVVLKRLADAQKDNDRIYAVIRGSGCNNDGLGEGPMTPRAAGQRDALARAYADARISPETLGFVETHGTATAVGDVVEVGALTDYFRTQLGEKASTPFCYLSSVKANIGHTMSAAGIAGFIKTALVLHHRTIAPQPSCEELNPKLGLDKSPFHIARKATEWKVANGTPRRAGVSSFGFGGTNVHVVLEEAPVIQKVSTQQPQLLWLSAGTPKLLGKYAGQLADRIRNGAADRLEDLARTLSERQTFDARVAFVAESLESAAQTLSAVEKALAEGDAAPQLPKGVFFASAPVPVEQRKLAFLFPGQGLQKIGLMEDLAQRFHGFRSRLESLDRAVMKSAKLSILDALYPGRSGKPYDVKTAQEHLTQTQVCQPAMAALGLALAELLGKAGVKPNVVLGHSLGEFVAASSVGMFSPEDAVALVAQRGQAMKSLPLKDGGAMLAVMAKRADVEKVVEGISGVVVGNLNHPTQVVLSGTTPGIQKATEKVQQAGLKFSRLDVSHAFHSPLMAGVDTRMASLVSALKLQAPSIPVVSCITGQPYGSVEDAAAVWRRHAASPVDFVSGLQSCVAQGANIFVQIGAGSALLSFARGTAPGSLGVSMSGAEADGATTFLQSLGQLFVWGVDIDGAILFEGTDASLVHLPATPLETQPYWGMERISRPTRSIPTPLSTPAATFPASSVKGVKMDSLVQLFRDQMALLQNQADILRRQNEALVQAAQGLSPDALATVTQAQATAAVASAGPAPLPLTNVVARPAAVPASPPAPSEPVLNVGAPVKEKIFSSVARISAFPEATLKPEQSLVGDLGFDSLMLVELDNDVGKAWPALGGLPRELFNKDTRIVDLVDHVAGALSSKSPRVAPTKAAPDASTANAASPLLTRYAPRLVSAPLRRLSDSRQSISGTLLITRDKSGVAERLSELMMNNGVDVVVDDGADERPVDAVLHLAEMTPSAHDPVSSLQRVLRLARRMRGAGGCFLSVTGMGGTLGLQNLNSSQLASVGVLGFTKALAQEWPETQVKAIDVDPKEDASWLAQALWDELRSGDRQNEVAYARRERFAVALEPLPDQAAKPLADNAVVVLTGGGRGLGAKMAVALAKAKKARLALLGRTQPDAQVQRTLDDVSKAGGQAVYLSVDVQNKDSVAQALASVRARYGGIDAVIHAAGVLADGPVKEKDPAALERVVETKLKGAQHLAAATEKDSLSVFAVISSWSGRFGNAFQTDYSAANDMLNRWVSTLHASRPSVKAVSLAYPPWEDSAMARKIPGFKKAEMRERGVPFLTDEEGLQAFLKELDQNHSGEVLLGRDVPARVLQYQARFPVSRLTHVYLNDHQMAGQPVLPLAAALDHAATTASESLSADGRFTLRDFRLQRGVMVPDTTWLQVDVHQNVNGTPSSTVELFSSKDRNERGALSYRATFEAAVPAALTPATAEHPKVESLPLTLGDFYKSFTFHGPRLQGVTSVEAIGPQGIIGWVKASKPSEWVKDPVRKAWTVDPLVIDASFQLAGYWAWVRHQRAGFPLGFSEYIQLAPFGDGPIRCTLVMEASEGDVLKGNIAYHSQDGRLLAVMNGVEAEFKRRDPQFVRPAQVAAAPAENSEPAAETIDESNYRVEMFPEVIELSDRLQMAEAFGLKNPYFNVHERVTNDTSVIGGREMINFSSYNYVGMSGDPVVSAAAKAAVERYGTSVSASRIASGEKPLHRELESKISEFLGTEDCFVLVSGHATNVTVVGHLVGPNDLILHDALAHDSILQGAKLSGAKRRPFPHNDFDALDRALTSLRPHYRRVLIAIEGVYSMDGDIADLPRVIELKKKHKALLLVDEAHSLGVLGKTGGGVGEHFNINRADVDLWMGTLSKSLASCGGYIAGSKALIQYLKYTTPGFIYSVGLSPPNTAASIAALDQMKKHPERVERLHQQARKFLEGAKKRGINTGLSKDSAVIPCIVGNSVHCLQLSDALFKRGINVQPILYPAVEEEAARLRFFLTATHTDAQIEFTLNVLAEELAKLNEEQAQTA